LEPVLTLLPKTFNVIGQNIKPFQPKHLIFSLETFDVTTKKLRSFNEKAA